MVANPGEEFYRWQKTQKLMDVSGRGGVLGTTEPTVIHSKDFFGVQQGMALRRRSKELIPQIEVMNQIIRIT